LYDYETDPLESQNLAGKPTHAEVQAKLEKQLRADAQGCDRLLQGKQ
jgi:hypothetical protein